MNKEKLIELLNNEENFEIFKFLLHNSLSNGLHISTFKGNEYKYEVYNIENKIFLREMNMFNKFSINDNDIEILMNNYIFSI